MSDRVGRTLSGVREPAPEDAGERRPVGKERRRPGRPRGRRPAAIGVSELGLPDAPCYLDWSRLSADEHRVLRKVARFVDVADFELRRLLSIDATSIAEMRGVGRRTAFELAALQARIALAVHEGAARIPLGQRGVVVVARPGALAWSDLDAWLRDDLTSVLEVLPRRMKSCCGGGPESVGRPRLSRRSATISA